MSWDIFKKNVLRIMNNPEIINDVDTVARLFATEYDAAIRRGGDTVNQIAIQTGNVKSMEQLFKAALLKGLTSVEPYDLVGEMGDGVISYWVGATLNQFPLPIIPAIGSVQNIGITSNSVTNPGTWGPVVVIPPQTLTQLEIPIVELLNTIPDDNNTVEGVSAAVVQTGVEFVTDDGEDGGEQLKALKKALPPDNPPYEETDGEELPVEESTTDTKSTLCGAAVDYESKISPNYKLRNLSIDCTFPHKIREQAGLSTSDIVCNLQNLAMNVLEPIKRKYPNVIINSAFRGTPSIAGKVSQHEKGEAIDLQFVGLKPKDYLDVSDWILKNIPFDQFIFEHGNNIWLHISCKRGAPQRKMVLTMYKGTYKKGIKLHYK